MFCGDLDVWYIYVIFSTMVYVFKMNWALFIIYKYFRTIQQIRKTVASRLSYNKRNHTGKSEPKTKATKDVKIKK